MPREQATQHGEQLWELVDDIIWQSVDESITSRVDTFELDGRIRALLRTRTASKKLKRSQERYRTITEDVLDRSAVGVMILDGDDLVVWANRASTDYLGLDRDHVLNRHMPPLLRNEIAAAIEAGDAFADRVLTSYERSEYIDSLECHVPPDDTITERWLEYWSQRIEVGRYAGGRIEHFTDITRRKERTQRLAVLHRVLRHNLRNSINVIRGRAEHLAGVVDASLHEHTDEIVVQSDRTLALSEKAALIDDAIESESREPVDLGSVVQRITASARKSYPAATVEVDAPDTVWVAALPSIEAALFELVENAVIHSDRPEPTVRIEVSNTTDSVEVAVADDCPPIPETEVAVVQGTVEVDQLTHGSGLGLWLVGWVVRRSNGDLRIDENDPRGNVVVVQLQATDPPVYDPHER